MNMRTWIGFRKPVFDTGRAAGYSMVELTVVVTISLILGAIAIPNMIAVISNARLHAGVTSMSGLLQNARMVAVKTNRTLTTHFGTINGHTLVGWVKTVSDTSPRVATDLQAEWEAPVQMMGTPSGVCTNDGFLYYFKDTSRPGSKGWAALSISPAGRIKKWFWTGLAWVD